MEMDFNNGNVIKTKDYSLYGYHSEVVLEEGSFKDKQVLYMKANYICHYTYKIPHLEDYEEKVKVEFSVSETKLPMLIKKLKELEKMSNSELESLSIMNPDYTEHREVLLNENLFILDDEEETGLVFINTFYCKHEFLNLRFELKIKDHSSPVPIMLVFEKADLEDLIMFFEFSLKEIEERHKTVEYINSVWDGYDISFKVHRKGVELFLTEEDELDKLIKDGLIEDVEEE